MQGQPTKQRRIFESVRQRIQTGAFQPGDRIPSDSELVREFGVSRPTVAKALQELERAGLVRRKTGSGTYVLRTGDEGLHFGLLIPGLGTTEIFEPICSEMARVAQQAGHGILWGDNARQPGCDGGELALELCEHYVRSRVGGVFFAPIEHAENKDQINRRIVARFDEADIPMVLLDRDFVAYPNRSDYDLVGVDNRRVGYSITHHLFQRGAERVVFLALPSSASTIDARVAGFIEAVVRDSGTFDESLVCRCDPRDQTAVGELMARVKPSAIVCGNDITAGRLMHCLDLMGIDVPEDVLVAGIDDVKYAELLRVPLTTIRQPCAALGDAAMRAMLERLETPDAPPRDILLGCELIERVSTRQKRAVEGGR